MRIRLLHDYGGKRTKEQRIPPGDYEDDNPLLWGLAWYLIEAGHAVEIEGLPEPQTPPTMIPVQSDSETLQPENPPEFLLPPNADFIKRDGDIVTYSDKLNGVMTMNAKTGETRSTGKRSQKHRK